MLGNGRDIGEAVAEADRAWSALRASAYPQPKSAFVSACAASDPRPPCYRVAVANADAAAENVRFNTFDKHYRDSLGAALPASRRHQHVAARLQAAFRFCSARAPASRLA